MSLVLNNDKLVTFTRFTTENDIIVWDLESGEEVKN